MIPQRNSRSGLRPPLRALLLGAALALALWSIVDYLAWRNEQNHLAHLLVETGLADRHPDFDRSLQRKGDAVLARLLVAQALLTSELDRSWLADLSDQEQALQIELGLDRLELARRTAEECLRLRPASWRAATILGGSEYLLSVRRRESRPRRLLESWEKALVTARRIGPGQIEPSRFLAAAYLGNWVWLTPDKKDKATAVLQEAFQDQRTFGLLIATWLRLAPTLDTALSLVPAEPWAWRKLQDLFARVPDWQRYREARLRWSETLETDLSDRLAEAERQLRGGASRSARSTFLSVVTLLPVDLRYAPLLQRILEQLPPGPVSGGHARAFRRWLDWTLDLCVLRECPLPAATLRRLAGVSGRLEPHETALAALAVGDLPQGELLERRAATVVTEGWAPYLILKARFLTEHGEPDAALESLQLVHPNRTRSELYWQAREAAAKAAGDEALAMEAADWLRELSRDSWPPFAWRWQDHVARLEMLPAATGNGIEIELTDRIAQGAVVELRLDGGSVGVFTLTPGQALTADLDLTPEIHLLEVVRLAGGGINPGEVQLLPPA